MRDAQVGEIKVLYTDKNDLKEQIYSLREEMSTQRSQIIELEVKLQLAE